MYIENLISVWRCGWKDCNWIGLRDEIIDFICPCCKSKYLFPALDRRWPDNKKEK